MVRTISLTRARARAVPELGLASRQDVGWGGGETITFSVKLAGVEGGRGAISVGAPRTSGGRTTVNLRGLSETVPFISLLQRIREEIVTRVDLAGLAPLHSTSDRLLDGVERRVEATFGRVIRQVIRRDGKTTRRERIVARPYFDPLTALYLIRSLSFAPGARLTLRIVVGLTLFRVQLTARGPERIYSRVAAHDTFRIDGVAQEVTDGGSPLAGEPGRRISIWLGTDQKRTPLRLEGDSKLGPVEASLTSYRAPRKTVVVRVPQDATPK
jgi:hypothetical protein